MACDDIVVFPDGSEADSDGIASWYCCGSIYSPFCRTIMNSGACGTCDNYSIACAWPNLAGFSPSNYAAVCRPNLPLFSCGQTIRLVSYCNGNNLYPYIADHGPFTDHFCGVNPPCRPDFPCNDRIIDLTPAAFMSIASISDGVTKVFVVVQL
jgi:hypothetical protein